MEENIDRTVDSFFGDEEHTREENTEPIESARSLDSEHSQKSSPRSSRSSSSSSRSSKSSRSSRSSSRSSVSSGSKSSRSASPSVSDHSSSGASTARSASSTVPNLAENETARTNGTTYSNDFDTDEVNQTGDSVIRSDSLQPVKLIEPEKTVETEKPAEIGAGDANILTVNIPSGQTPRPDSDQESDHHSELTEISPMATPRPDQSIEIEEVKLRPSVRPKSAHPSKGRTRKASTTSSVASSKHSVNSSINEISHTHQTQIEKHRERLLYNTSKSSKDINQLLEAVLVLDQKGKKRERTQNTNPFPPRVVGSAQGRRPNYRDLERQKQIQKENDRLLKELTKQQRRPTSAVSVASGRSVRSNISTRSAFSTASAMEMRRTVNCKYSPVAKNYHSKINREKEAKRIDQENLALLRRLQSVKPSVQIQVSRQAVSTQPLSRRPRPKSMRPKVVNTWTDGW